MAMKHNYAPPTINVEVADPECDLDYVPNTGREVRIDAALCNCIAFGSKNSALVFKKFERNEWSFFPNHRRRGGDQ